MVVVTTTGYFLTAVGPYLADGKNNDAAILTHMFKTNVQDIQNWMHEEDIFVIDRGFRDAVSLLEEIGIRAEIPSFMKRGEKQLSTKDANLSRLVTKVEYHQNFLTSITDPIKLSITIDTTWFSCMLFYFNIFLKVRWVVESANSRIKRWKFLDKVLPTNQVPYVGDFVRIVCAISNKFLPALSKGTFITCYFRCLANVICNF